MKKTFQLLFAALLPLLVSNHVPAEPKAKTWLLAQERPLATCELDNRRVPSGTRLCVEQHVWVCGASGSWQNTGKPC